MENNNIAEIVRICNDYARESADGFCVQLVNEGGITTRDVFFVLKGQNFRKNEILSAIPTSDVGADAQLSLLSRIGELQDLVGKEIPYTRARIISTRKGERAKVTFSDKIYFSDTDHISAADTFDEWFDNFVVVDDCKLSEFCDSKHMSFFYEIAGTEVPMYQLPKYKELFYYTSFETFKSIIENNEIWATDLNKQNDPNEFRTGYDYVIEYLENEGTPFAKKVLGELKKNISDIGPIELENILITCMTKERDSVAMWDRVYADSGKGVCIGFNIPDVREHYINDEGNLFGSYAPTPDGCSHGFQPNTPDSKGFTTINDWRPILYTKYEAFFEIDRVFKFYSKKYSSSCNEDLVFLCWQDLLQAPLYMKDNGWRAEAEERLVVKSVEEDESKIIDQNIKKHCSIAYDEKFGYWLSKLTDKKDKLPISRVILGPNFAEDESAVSELLVKNCYNDTIVEKSTMRLTTKEKDARI